VRSNAVAKVVSSTLSSLGKGQNNGRKVSEKLTDQQIVPQIPCNQYHTCESLVDECAKRGRYRELERGMTPLTLTSGQGNCNSHQYTSKQE
jgi:hypothetical protein